MNNLIKSAIFVILIFRFDNVVALDCTNDNSCTTIEELIMNNGFTKLGLQNEYVEFLKNPVYNAIFGTVFELMKASKVKIIKNVSTKKINSVTAKLWIADSVTSAIKSKQFAENGLKSLVDPVDIGLSFMQELSLTALEYYIGSKETQSYILGEWAFKQFFIGIGVAQSKNLWVYSAIVGEAQLTYEQVGLAINLAEKMDSEVDKLRLSIYNNYAVHARAFAKANYQYRIGQSSSVSPDRLKVDYLKRELARNNLELVLLSPRTQGIWVAKVLNNSIDLISTLFRDLKLVLVVENDLENKISNKANIKPFIIQTYQSAVDESKKDGDAKIAFCYYQNFLLDDAEWEILSKYVSNTEICGYDTRQSIYWLR